MDLAQLVEGHKIFKEKNLPLISSELKDLVRYGQKPKIMFIGCCDSRVTPDLMLNTRPGDMFILRNVGNFVAPFKHDEDFHGSAAAIEYAVAILKVEHIIVCGHSHCGACESLYKEMPVTNSLIHVKTWLKLGMKAKERTLKNKKFTTEEEMYRETERNSIRHQLNNLLTYPDIKRLLEKKEIKIHGWYYDIETGDMSFYDKENDIFKPLNEIKI